MNAAEHKEQAKFHDELRQSERSICAKFPDEYCR